MDVQQIGDRLEIEDLLVRYTRAIDTGEWDRLDEVFTPDAVIDYTASGGIAGSYAEVKEWLARMLPIFPRRMHLLGQREVVVGWDAATVTAYFDNPMVMLREDGPEGARERVVEIGGLYHHELVRTDAGWRSWHLVEELVWSRGL